MEEEKRKRKSKPKLTQHIRPVLLLVILVSALYLGAQVYSAFSGGIQTVTAARITANDSFFTRAWFFRQEIPVSGNSGESIRHIVYSGERVQQDAPLATVYSDEQSLELSRELEPIDNKIRLLDAALQSVDSSGDAAKLDQLITVALQQMAAQVKSGSGAALSASAESLHTLSLRRIAGNLDTTSIASEKNALIQQRESIESQLSGKTTQLKSPTSGYFSEIIDGYENVLTVSSLENLTLDSFYELTTQKQDTEDINYFGKIVEGFNWYLAAEITADQASRLQEGQSLRIGFLQASLESPVTVYKILKERNEDTALVIFEGSNFNSEMVSMREQPIEIIIGTYTGLMVPKQAVRMVSNGNGGETEGVYILSGSVTKEKKIDKIFDAGDYYVVRQSATDAGALVAQDQIIVRGKDLQNNMVVKT